MRSSRQNPFGNGSLELLGRVIQQLLSGLVVNRAARPRGELIRLYRGELVRRENTPRYVRESIRYLERLIPLELPLEQVTAAILAERISTIKGCRSRIVARRTLHTFFCWLVDNGEVIHNPVIAIPPTKYVASRPPRRPLSEAELERIIAETPPDEAIPADRWFERGTVYLLSATTGLRFGAIARLELDSIDLDKAIVRYRTKKRDKDKMKPIPAVTVERLRRWLELRATLPIPATRLFRSVPRPRTFVKDLARCGIPRVTAEGEVNRHALRVTFCTRLFMHAKAETPLVQGLLDHSDPRLTMGYTKLPSALERDAVERAAPKRKRRGKQVPRRPAEPEGGTSVKRT